MNLGLDWPLVSPTNRSLFDSNAAGWVTRNARKLIDVRYQRAFVDFFEDQLVQHGYDWRDLLKAYLFEGEKPLINNMICGCELFLY